MSSEHQSSQLTNPPIIATRVFDAPRELVFGMFSDPSILAKWWGPQGFTNTFHTFDFRPGGAWLFVMHSPDGIDYEITKNFIEIIYPGHISLRNLQPTHNFQMTMTFAEEAGRTRLTWIMQFESGEEAERIRNFIIEANEQNFDRLEAQLAALSP